METVFTSLAKILETDVQGRAKCGVAMAMQTAVASRQQGGLIGKMKRAAGSVMTVGVKSRQQLDEWFAPRSRCGAPLSAL